MFHLTLRNKDGNITFIPAHSIERIDLVLDGACIYAFDDVINIKGQSATKIREAVTGEAPLPEVILIDAEDDAEKSNYPVDPPPSLIAAMLEARRPY